MVKYQKKKKCLWFPFSFYTGKWQKKNDARFIKKKNVLL